MPLSIILKDDLEKKESLLLLKNFLIKANTLKFWQTHFANKRFHLRTNNFNWEYWLKIPFITKKDFERIKFTKRLEDAKLIVKDQPNRFILQSTSGTSKQTGPLLFLKNVDCLVDGDYHNKGKRTLILYQGRAISLRDVIALKKTQSLAVNPFTFDRRMIEAIKDFKPDASVTFPASFGYLISSFPKLAKAFSSISYVWLSGDFFSLKQRNYTRLMLKKARLDIDYITTEVDTIGICCKFLQAKYGMNAYHPFKDRLVELINVDELGFGEVVVTKISPLELSYIRYRTGDIARAVYTSCNCGQSWVIFLEGRGGMDYIKSLGVLVTRAEIERVLKRFDKIVEEWRGEVREVEFRKTLLGELTLIIKLKRKLSNADLKMLQQTVSKGLLLTPKKTLTMLVKEHKFMPLTIKIVDQFPQSAKKVLLKKILD